MSALQPLSRLLTQVWPVMEVLLRKGRNWWMSVESQSFWTFLVVARCMMWNSNGKFLGGGSFRLITEVLEVDDVVQGTVQVQRINIPVGKWSELCSGQQWLGWKQAPAVVWAMWPCDFVPVGEVHQVWIWRWGTVGVAKKNAKYSNQSLFLLVASGPIVGPLARAQIVVACNMFADLPTQWSPQTLCNWCEAMAEAFLDLEEWLRCHPDAPATTCVST